MNKTNRTLQHALTLAVGVLIAGLLMLIAIWTTAGNSVNASTSSLIVDYEAIGIVEFEWATAGTIDTAVAPANLTVGALHDLGSIDLGVLLQGGGGTLVSGYVDLDRTLTITGEHTIDLTRGLSTTQTLVGPSVTGSFNGTSLYLRSPEFSYVTKSGETFTREFRLSGTLVDDVLTGTYRESAKGLTSETMTMGGSFEMVLVEPEKYVCPTSFPIDVANEQELDTALQCFGVARGGEQTINLTSDILLSENSVEINNRAGAALLINGNGYTIDGDDVARVLNVEFGSVQANNITLTRGKADARPCPYTVINPCGGAVFVAPDASFTLVDGSITDSTSDRYGGGIYSQGTLSITNSTISGNTAVQSGGGIRLDGGAVTIVNSTISGNSADYGGGLNINFSGIQRTFIKNSTFNNNSAQFKGGALYIESTSVGVSNSIFANSTSGNDCLLSFSTLNTDANSLDTDGSCGDATQMTSAEINLGPLQDNGGPTWTHALQTGSVAIDAATADPAITTDQRGASRTGDAAPDVGAFEFGSVPTTVRLVPNSVQASGLTLLWALGFVAILLLTLVVIRKRAAAQSA